MLCCGASYIAERAYHEIKGGSNRLLGMIPVMPRPFPVYGAPTGDLSAPLTPLMTTDVLTSETIVGYELVSPKGRAIRSIRVNTDDASWGRGEDRSCLKDGFALEVQVGTRATRTW